MYFKSAQGGKCPFMAVVAGDNNRECGSLIILVHTENEGSLDLALWVNRP